MGRMGLLHRLSLLRLSSLPACGLTLWVGTLGLIVFSAVTVPAQAVPLSQEAQTQVDALTAQAQQVQADLDALDEELHQKTEEYNKCLDKMAAANARMFVLRRMVADARADMAHAQATLAQRIKAIYMSGGRDQLLQLLFLADNLQDFYNRVRLVSMLADQDKRLVADLKNSAIRLSILVKGIDDQKREELAIRRELSERSEELQAAVTRRARELAALEARVKTIIEQEHQRQLAEMARLEQERQARLLAARAAAQRGSSILTPEQIAVVAQRAGFKGENLVIAVAVALAESGGNASAQGDVAIGGSFGLWQIYCVAHPDLIPPWNPDAVAWYDPYQNAQWAYKISGGSNWRPWSTYKHGTYERHMAAAQAAVSLLFAAAPPAAPSSGDTPLAAAP
jgi:peptidoglycan hydrolase CwlO-like protein